MSYIPFVLLSIAVLGLWLHRNIWSAALILSIIAAYFTGALQGLAAVWIAILAALALFYVHARARDGKPLQLFAAGLLFTFALALGLLLLPGFPRTVLAEPVVLSPGAAPYGITLGFPKVVAGILILGLVNTVRASSPGELAATLRRAAPIFLLTLTAVMAGALLLGYARFDPKWTTLFLIWAPINLFFTCLSEEAFFRGFVQHELARAIRHPTLAIAIPVTASAVLFGLSHFGGGWKYVLAGTVAGLGYAWTYQRTQRIEAAMAVHFGVNAVHFLLFTYPRLA
ncbi:MAG: CPBP family intramembrane glutamic endopeptidase [Pseudomonadota bacterium]